MLIFPRLAKLWKYSIYYPVLIVFLMFGIHLLHITLIVRFVTYILISLVFHAFVRLQLYCNHSEIPCCCHGEFHSDSRERFIANRWLIVSQSEIRCVFESQTYGCNILFLPNPQDIRQIYICYRFLPTVSYVFSLFFQRFLFSFFFVSIGTFGLFGTTTTMLCL